MIEYWILAVLIMAGKNEGTFKPLAYFDSKEECESAMMQVQLTPDNLFSFSCVRRVANSTDKQPNKP